MSRKLFFVAAPVLLSAALIILSCPTDSDGGGLAGSGGDSDWSWSQNTKMSPVAVQQLVDKAEAEGAELLLRNVTIGEEGTVNFKRVPVRIEGTLVLSQNSVIVAPFDNFTFAKGAYITGGNYRTFLIANPAMFNKDTLRPIPDDSLVFVDPAKSGQAGQINFVENMKLSDGHITGTTFVWGTLTIDVDTMTNFGGSLVAVGKVVITAKNPDMFLYRTPIQPWAPFTVDLSGAYLVTTSVPGWSEVVSHWDLLRYNTMFDIPTGSKMELSGGVTEKNDMAPSGTITAHVTGGGELILMDPLGEAEITGDGNVRFRSKNGATRFRFPFGDEPLWSWPPRYEYNADPESGPVLASARTSLHGNIEANTILFENGFTAGVVLSGAVSVPKLGLEENYAGDSSYSNSPIIFPDATSKLELKKGSTLSLTSGNTPVLTAASDLYIYGAEPTTFFELTDGGSLTIRDNSDAPINIIFEGDVVFGGNLT
jgi:hypothetical protein